MSGKNDDGSDETAGPANASETITIEFLRSFTALQQKSDEQLGDIVTKLKNELIETTSDLDRVSRESLFSRIPALALDALKPLAPAPESPQRPRSNVPPERIWNSVLRAENTGNDESATALVFDVFQTNQRLYMLLLMNQHFRFNKNHVIRVLQYDESGQCSLVEAFARKDLKIFARGNMKDRHEDYVIYQLELDQNEWELTEPGMVRRLLKPPPSKKPRKTKSAAEMRKTEIICKTPRYSYSINPSMPVRIFGFPHTATGRWEGASIVTSIDRSTFGLQMLSAQGLSGGAVVATEQGDIVGIMGGNHDTEENGKPKPFNAYAVHAHSFPKRPSSQPPSPESEK